jgi:hypothetical protein
MTPDMVRRFWSVVEGILRPELVMRQNDDLTRLLLHACLQEDPLRSVDSTDLNTYISVHLPLIRDLVLG